MTLVFKGGLLVVLLVVAAAAIWLWMNSRAMVESPVYEVVEHDGLWEIRQYPAFEQVTTPMQDTTMNGGFGRLFRYITGENDKAQKISMTTPVLIDRKKGAVTMSFIVPRAVAASGAPVPRSGDVVLGKSAAGRFAVLRFSGSPNDGRAEQEAAAIADLLSRVRQHGLETEGEPLVAYYDPPWTPGFLRRSEVLVRLRQG